jgi:hypothetical protein
MTLKPPFKSDFKSQYFEQKKMRKQSTNAQQTSS